MGQCKDCQWYNSEHENCVNKKSDEFSSPRIAPDSACRFFRTWDLKKPEGAVKYDAGKLSMSMIPLYPLERLAEVYMVGAAKYTRNNWRKGMEWHRVYDAVQRHLMAFWQGEDMDREDGIPHLAHAIWGMFTLMEYQRLGLGEDDRDDA